MPLGLPAAPRRMGVGQVAAIAGVAFILGAVGVLVLTGGVPHGAITEPSLARSVARSASIELDPSPPFAGGAVRCESGRAASLGGSESWACRVGRFDESGGTIAATYEVRIHGSCWTASYRGEQQTTGEGVSLPVRLKGCVPLVDWNGPW